MTTLQETLITLNQHIQALKLDGTITYRSETSHLMRGANNQISLNTTEKGSKFFIELQQGKRFSRASVTADPGDPSRVITAITRAAEAIENMPELPHATPLKPIAAAPEIRANDPSLEQPLSDTMLALFHDTVQHFSGKNTQLSGAFSAGVFQFGVINTRSALPLIYAGSDFNIELVLQLAADKKEIRTSQVGNHRSQFNPTALIAELDRLYQLKTTTPRSDLAPGKYDVVFGHDALADLVSFLSGLALSGETYEFEVGMLQKATHQIGDKIWHETFSLTDDPSHPEALFAYRFGLNGIAKATFPLIENGILKNLVYSDKLECDRFGKVPNNDLSTANLIMTLGNGPASFDDMVKACTTPTLYIGYLHYMNCPNAPKGEITASSRFGTFLIENGQIKSHLYNLRINDTLFNLFGQIEWLSAARAWSNVSDTYGLRMAEAVALPLYTKINQVTITGTSKTE